MERKARSLTLENYGTESTGATGLQITTANPNQQIKLATTFLCLSLGGKSQNPATCYNPLISIRECQRNKRNASEKIGETSPLF